MQQIVREHQAYPPKIVASVTSWELWKTLKGKDLTDQCDLVELRLDALPPELTTEQVMEFRPEMPLLVTVRCHEEGGLRRIPEEERFALLRAYMPYAAAMDIEIKAMRHARELVMEARERDVIIIGSTHDFQITPGVDYLREQEKRRAPTRRISSNLHSRPAWPRTSRQEYSFHQAQGADRRHGNGAHGTRLPPALLSTGFLPGIWLPGRRGNGPRAMARLTH